jgi:hypothetical protein
LSAFDIRAVSAHTAPGSHIERPAPKAQQ